MENAMLTTIDNPYNPFKNFDEWMAFDEQQARIENRPTCYGYLARMTPESDDVSDKEYDEIVETLIDEIVELNLGGKFVKITEKEAENLI